MLVKTFGANIYCSICRAQPYPGDPGVRESFDLQRDGDEWRCELHRPPLQKRVPRVAAAKPPEALGVFEGLFEAQVARLRDAVDDALQAKQLSERSDDAEEALEVFQHDVGRGLDELRKALDP
jgi:hypothetical protein